MGRGRKKSGAGTVEATRYDIFGNVIGERDTTPAAPTTPVASTPKIPDVADEDMIEDRWYLQEEDNGTPYVKLRMPNGRIITAAATMAATEEQDGFDARSTDTFDVSNDTGTVIDTFTVPDAFNSETGTWNPDALMRAANEWFKNSSYSPPTESENMVQRERASRAIYSTISDVTSLATDNPRGDPKSGLAGIKALDVQKLTDGEISRMQDQIYIALRDNLAPAVTRILLASPTADRFSVDIFPQLRNEMRYLLRGVDTLGIVSATLRREIERRGGIAGASITQAQAERTIIPAIRNQLRGDVQYEIRQRQKAGKPLPDWAKDPGKIVDYVDRSLDFDPIEARKR